MMNGVFNTSLVETSAFALRQGGFVMPYHKPLMDGMYAELFEQLLLFDKVSIILAPFDCKPIGALLERFRLGDLVRALELEAIEIILPRTYSMVNTGPHGRGEQDASLLQQQPPVLRGIIQSGIDPEQVVRDGLQFTNKFSEQQKREVVRLIAPHIKWGSLTDGEDANRIVLDAYDSNSLAPVGIPYVGSSFDFDVPARVRFQGIVTEVEDLLFVADNNYGLYKSPGIYDIAKAAVGNVEDALNVQRTNDKLLVDNALPNLRLLYSSGKADFGTAINLRESADNIEFRRWIYSISDPAAYNYIIRNYAAAIARPVGFSESSIGKLSKGVVMYGLGQLVTSGAGIAAATLIGGPVGIALGLGAHLLSETLLKSTFEVTGNLFLDKVAGSIAKGWTPLQFVEQVQVLAEGTIQNGRGNS